MSQQLTQALASIERPGVFAARREVSPAALRLSVTGVGPIAFPISSAQARELCGVARPARHGFKDETRLDRRVRNTWEIAKSRTARLPSFSVNFRLREATA